MRIAVWHNLPSGGAKRGLYDHVRGLLSRGHHVEVWCPSTADRKFLALDGLVREHVLPMEWDLPRPKGRLEELRAPYRSWTHRIQALHRHCQECAAEINQGGFDLLFGNTSMLTAVAPIAQYVKLPSVLYLQEPHRALYEASAGQLWIAPRADAPRRRGPRGWLDFSADLIRLQGLRVIAREELEGARAFDRILVNSYFSRESVLRAYGLDSQVSYMGVDTELFQDRGREREGFVVGVGAFAPAKNIELAIRAIGAIPEPRPRLVWAGNATVGDYLERLRGLAHSLHVDLEAAPVAPGEDLVQLLNRASLMIYTPRLEPFGLAPLEANACGVPVVAIAEGGLRETVVNGVNGAVVAPDPAVLGEAVAQLLQDRQRASRLRTQCRQFVEAGWTLAHGTDNLERHLLEVARTQNPAELVGSVLP